MENSSKVHTGVGSSLDCARDDKDRDRFSTASLKRMEKDEIRGTSERTTGVYKDIHEDCERSCNKEDRFLRPFKKVCVIGLGYIGLPTAVVFALHGAKVLGVDINPKVLDLLRQGKMHFIEPDLDAVLAQVIQQESLTVSDQVSEADVFIIAVPTPFSENYQPDLSYVEAAFRSIAPVLKKGDCVILESTSPVGTTDKMASLLAELRSDLVFPNNDTQAMDVHVCYCPERVLPGRVLHELIYNDRVIGGLTEHCAEHACDVYRLFLKGQCLKTNARTAEMAKLTENAFRDVNIAFANELSMVCEEEKINAWELIRLANHHPRVNILQPGPGVGGHCIAVDPWFIISKSSNAKLMRSAREVNQRKPEFVVDHVKHIASDDEHPHIVCFGLSYKKDIDDLRESPAVDIVKQLAEQGYALSVVEPHVSELPSVLSRYNNVTLVSDWNTAVADQSIVVMLVNHTAFKSVAFSNNVRVIDVCGIFSA